MLARANSDPAAILAALGEPTRAGVTPLYKSDTLTVLNVVWGKRMTIMPHDHRMWAVIGVYTGREDNIFWRRVADEAGGLVEAAGAKSLSERCAEPLGRDVIHSVTNPLGRLTAGIHVYGGNFYGVKRSDWDPENLLELAFAAFGHARFNQAPQRGEFLGQVPADQWCRLVESADLAFEQSQVMQRVETKPSRS